MSIKRSITLIELLISFSLMSILLGSLFGWYHQLNTNKAEIEKLKRSHMERKYAWQRLEHILPKARLPFFYDEGLIFRFSRGPYHEPKLSETVLGKLYYNTTNQTLCLGIWPDPLDEIEYSPSQTFTLLEGITKCSFAFYSPPDPFNLTVSPKKIGHPQPEEKWQDTWSIEYDTLPAFITVTFTQETREYTLFFDLNHPITYPCEAT